MDGFCAISISPEDLELSGLHFHRDMNDSWRVGSQKRRVDRRRLGISEIPRQRLSVNHTSGFHVMTDSPQVGNLVLLPDSRLFLGLA